MRSCRSGFALLALFALAARGDDFGFDDDASEAAPADPWAGITQLFPDTRHPSSVTRHPSLPSLELVGEFDLPDSAPEGLSGIAWTSNPGHPEIVDPDPFGRAGGPGPRFDICTPDSYVLCEDSGAWLDFAEIGIDRASGAITSAVFRLRSRAYFYSDDEPHETADFEAIAYARSRHDRTHYQLYVSDEAHPYVWQDRLKPCTTGVVAVPSPIVPVSLPEPLRGHRPNKGVEAMCLSPDDRALWLALEDAHPEDGPVATSERGALVRLVRMDAMPGVSKVLPEANLPTQWWFYPLDAATGTSLPHLPAPFNGLAELCALPDGRLLALERSFGFRTRSPEDPRGSLITISIYLIDPLHAEAVGNEPHAEGAELESHAESAENAENAENGGASSPSEPPPSAARTAAAPRPPVLAKTLLWRGLVGRSNYEGMTLGPELADGSRALLLVADGDVTRKGRFSFAWRKSLLSFRLRLTAARPGGPGT